MVFLHRTKEDAVYVCKCCGKKFRFDTYANLRTFLSGRGPLYNFDSGPLFVCADCNTADSLGTWNRVNWRNDTLLSSSKGYLGEVDEDLSNTEWYELLHV
jgi:hypothetical protein